MVQQQTTGRIYEEEINFFMIRMEEKEPIIRCLNASHN